MLAEELDYVVGVDTHRDEHGAVVARKGRLARRDPRRTHGAGKRDARHAASRAAARGASAAAACSTQRLDVRREALVQLRSVVVTAPDRLREQLRGLPAQRLI